MFVSSRFVAELQDLNNIVIANETLELVLQGWQEAVAKICRIPK